MEGMELSEANSSVTVDEHISGAKAMANTSTASIHANVWPHLEIFLCFQSFSIKSVTPHELANFENNHDLLLPVAVGSVKVQRRSFKKRPGKTTFYNCGGNYGVCCFIAFTASFWFLLPCQELHGLLGLYGTLRLLFLVTT